MDPLTFKTGQNTFIVAEVAQAHDGNINFAHAFIEAVAKTGAQAIKFQTHIAEEESTPGEPWRVKFSYQDDRRYDYWKRMEFTKDQWAELKKHADEKGLHFLSSPFSIKAVDLLEEINIPAWKIGSGEVLSDRMLARIAQTKKPVILSSGMSDFKEIDRITAYLKDLHIEYALMQCTTAYPTQFDQVGLNVISEMKARYQCPVGLSDHSGTIWPSIAAATLGAELLEVHVKIGADMPGPDSSSSLTIEELTQMVEGVRAVNTMQDNPIDKNKLTDNQKNMRQLFMKSIIARQDLSAGTVLSAEHLVEKKPSTGIPGTLIEKAFGLTLAKPVSQDEQLSWDHFTTKDQNKLKKEE